MAEKYPGWSPYVYSCNNPIAFFDPNGLWTDPVNKPQYRAFYYIQYATEGVYVWRPNSSHFGENIRNAGTRSHQGVDLRAPIGTETKAVMSGKVVYVGRTSEDDARGLRVELKFTGDDGKVYFAHYWHLSETSVKEGEQLSEGQVVGKTGNTGNASTLKPIEEHLHFGISDVEKPGKGVKGWKDPADLMNIGDPSEIQEVKPKGFTWEEEKNRPKGRGN